MPHGTARTDSRAASFSTSRRGSPCPFEVRRLHALGRGVQTIANILGCCMEDVSRIVNPPEGEKAEPTLKAKPDQRAPRDERLREMWMAGILRVEICEVLGIGAATLDRDRRRLRLPGRQTPRTPRKAAQ